MIKRKKNDNTDSLLNAVIEGMQEKKGKKIITLNLAQIENSICDYFVICEGESNTQVEAIADSVEELVKKIENERPIHKEGMENAHWIILDYASVVVHVFQKIYREYYNLENLWADAQTKLIESRY